MSGEKLKVLFVCVKPDFRCYKTAKALMDSGKAEPHLLAFTWDAEHAHAFESMARIGAPFPAAFKMHKLAKWASGGRLGPVLEPAMRMWLRKSVMRRGAIDIIHSTAPPTAMSRLLVGYEGAPVVFDQYDLILQTSANWHVWPSDMQDELHCLEHADGLVHKGPPEELEFYSARGHKLAQKQLSFPDGCDAAMFQPMGAPKLRDSDGAWHVVYAGGIHGPGMEYYLLPEFEALISQGIHIHVYPAPWSRDHEDLSCYRRLAEKDSQFHMHDCLPYPELVKAMSAYDFGMYYFDIDKPEFPGMRIKARTAAGNKVPSYYEAGIPVLMARKLEYSARMVGSDGSGILIGPEDIPRMRKLLDACDYRALQGAVAEARQRWSGAGRGAMLVEFYRTLKRSP